MTLTIQDFEELNPELYEQIEKHDVMKLKYDGVEYDVEIEADGYLEKENKDSEWYFYGSFEIKTDKDGHRDGLIHVKENSDDIKIIYTNLFNDEETKYYSIMDNRFVPHNE